MKYIILVLFLLSCRGKVHEERKNTITVDTLALSRVITYDTVSIGTRITEHDTIYIHDTIYLSRPKHNRKQHEDVRVDSIDEKDLIYLNQPQPHK